MKKDKTIEELEKEIDELLIHIVIMEEDNLDVEDFKKELKEKIKLKKEKEDEQK